MADQTHSAPARAAHPSPSHNSPETALTRRGAVAGPLEGSGFRRATCLVDVSDNLNHAIAQAKLIDLALASELIEDPHGTFLHPVHRGVDILLVQLEQLAADFDEVRKRYGPPDAA